MSTPVKVILGILIFVIIALVVLYFLGRNLQKKQSAQQAQIEAMKQTVSMLIIDKKRMKIKDSGLPQAVIAQTPKMLRNSKLPIVKAKVGPQVMSLIADDKIFDSIPVKKEVKAVVSGIYITDVKGLHGKQAPVETKKKGFFKRALEKAQEKAGATPLK
ncbi:MAG: hypothetical protein K2K21_08435 [Lachnospiraceae bacterium]|nr:hypothetical protein [Lachnospiraceae bacterium]MDE6749071.1 hypothetical protein [Lachnospiraceae bacterium]